MLRPTGCAPGDMLTAFASPSRGNATPPTLARATLATKVDFQETGRAIHRILRIPPCSLLQAVVDCLLQNVTDRGSSDGRDQSRAERRGARGAQRPVGSRARNGPAAFGVHRSSRPAMGVLHGGHVAAAAGVKGLRDERIGERITRLSRGSFRAKICSTAGSRRLRRNSAMVQPRRWSWRSCKAIGSRLRSSTEFAGSSTKRKQRSFDEKNGNGRNAQHRTSHWETTPCSAGPHKRP